MGRSFILPAVGLAAIVACTGVRAQVAGSTTIGVAVATVEVIASGWSARRQILGKSVFNENSEQVGRIEDLIIAPDTAVSFVIVGAGGFVGVKRHHVAIPVEQLTERDGLFVLPGATKAAIKALPNFEYAQ
ncbi:PRC-barrel domain-containing protein [Piscinibacter sp. XHJ-5]|uniref:PRC-barrel domain-containing protein n=1 Tax=Piscinibacter sp. XHJ-5 TaxID=3037797 RepID=UPI002452FE07|nr:PRC-barrel domain-containing protein [Piscinibacter sp. XHJ-5]